LGIFFALPDYYATTRESRAAAVADAMRKINSAQVAYARTYSLGFSLTLAALGPPPGATATNVSAAGLIDRELARGTQSDYTFRYIPGTRDATGKVTTYTLTANPSEPECAHWKRFFTDQTGTIRGTYEDRPANAEDLELQP
jgi:hypothetical protein